MKYLFIFLVFFNLTSSAFSQLSSNQYNDDFDYFWKQINEYYAYWDKKNTNWNKVRDIYKPAVDTITKTRSFILLLERVYNELYDHHAALSSNTTESQRLVPSGTDMWAEFINGKPIITEVRKGFGAEQVGLCAGMEIVSFNNFSIEEAIRPFLPLSVENQTNQARNYAIRILLAGKYTDDRVIQVRYGSTIKTYYPDRPVNLLKEFNYTGHIESKIYSGNIGYIKINNRLWDNKLIPLFDSVIQSMNNTKALILDLRETPSGGNTTVARAIIGSFIKNEGVYQKHELTSEETHFGIKRSWLELVSPRQYLYSKPLVLLVNHWTGSVGEGITIGFHALDRATVIGTKMAGLNGAIYSYKMPHTGINFSFPQEKLFHVNGTPRENFIPDILVDLKKQTRYDDLVLTTALNYLLKK